MTRLSPLDALGPAFRRTREVLVQQPFRLGLFLKIALVAALTQPSFYSASISYPIQGANVAAMRQSGHRFAMLAAPEAQHFAGAPGLAAIGIAGLVVALVIGLAIWIFFAYLYCRVRFTLFDLVVSRRGRVRQAWSHYGAQAWRYFGLVVLVSLAFLVLAAVFVGPTLVNFIRVVRPLMNAGPNANPFPVLGAMLPFLLSLLFLGLLWAVVDALMQDFLLPPMAIEDAPIEAAMARFFKLLRTDFGPVAIYTLLRFAVGLGITWILMLVLLMLFAVAGLAVFALGMLLYHALWASMLGQVICVALAIVVGTIVIVAYLVATIAIYGIAGVFKQSYAVQFFGGRYFELGNLLEPPPTEQASAELPVASFFPSPPPPSLDDAPPVW